MKRILPIVLGAALLAACATDPRDSRELKDSEIYAIQEAQTQRRAIGNALVVELSSEQIRKRTEDSLNDVTRVIYQRGHGVYAEYTAPDNRLYMWYPGNGVVVKGSWAVSDEYDPPRACFKYRGAYHGVTGEFEPNECIRPSQTLGEVSTMKSREGDVFGLAGNGVPYVKAQNTLLYWPEEWARLEAEDE